MAYPWPGNVRELRNIIERVALLSNSDVIDVRELTLANIALPENFAATALPPGESVTEDGDYINLRVDLSKTTNAIHDTNQLLISKILEMTGGNKTKAARLLGIPRGTLRYHLDRERGEGTSGQAQLPFDPANSGPST
jgi:DNA-binding NtrC family response regulator